MLEYTLRERMQRARRLIEPFSSQAWLRAKWEHTHNQLNENQIESIVKQHNIDFFWSHHLKPILIERIPGTKNHELVRKHIISRMKNLNAGWHIELDTFVDKPPEPYKEVNKFEMHNILERFKFSRSSSRQSLPLSIRMQNEN